MKRNEFYLQTNPVRDIYQVSGKSDNYRGEFRNCTVLFAWRLCIACRKPKQLFVFRTCQVSKQYEWFSLMVGSHCVLLQVLINL
jgi:hypothetical protein